MVSTTCLYFCVYYFRFSGLGTFIIVSNHLDYVVMVSLWLLFVRLIMGESTSKLCFNYFFILLTEMATNISMRHPIIKRRH